MSRDEGKPTAAAKRNSTRFRIRLVVRLKLGLVTFWVWFRFKVSIT